MYLHAYLVDESSRIHIQRNSLFRIVHSVVYQSPIHQRLALRALATTHCVVLRQVEGM